jgi:anthranilate phosphoribosyltransferase
LIAAGRSTNPREAAQKGAAALDSGAAAEVLRRLVEFAKK